MIKITYDNTEISNPHNDVITQPLYANAAVKQEFIQSLAKLAVIMNIIWKKKKNYRVCIQRTEFSAKL